MKIRIQYVFPCIRDTHPAYDFCAETETGEKITVHRFEPIDPRTFTKEIVHAHIDGEFVSALIEWLP